MSKKVLLAWELGDGLGHAARLRPLAQELQRRGHEVAMALRDLVQPADILAAIDCPKLQAPLWQHQTRGLPQPLASMAEILLSQGWLLAPHLRALVEGWLALFRLHGTELLVADYAPSAVLAARIAGIRSATVGIGFSIPPDTVPLPSFRPELQLPAARFAQAERAALASANAVLGAHGTTALDRLAPVLGGDLPLLCTWPELDHYGRPEAAVPRWFGPTFLAEAGGDKAPAWPAGTGPRVFAYLKAGHPDHAGWLQALVARGCRVLCYLPEVAAGKAPPLRAPNLVYATRPVSLGAVLPEADLLVCHAGEATLAQGLLAGVPLLLLPMQAEQALLARVVAASSGAARVHLPGGLVQSRETLAALLDAPGPRAQAAAFAERHRGFSHEQQTRDLVDQFQTLLHNAT